MNIAINEDFHIAYERSDEVRANIKVGRDSLVDVNEVLDYIRVNYFPELVVYSRSFAGFVEFLPSRKIFADKPNLPFMVFTLTKALV